MDVHTEQFPYLHYRGRLTTFARSEVTAKSYFGGPGQLAIRSAKQDPITLHHLATISTSDMGINDSRYGYSIPFYYGMCYEDCDLSYKLPPYTIEVASSPWIDITLINPKKSSKDWPYTDYPKLLPYIPLKIKDTIEMPIEIFSENVMQGIETLSDDELVFVIPPNSQMGVSLWGPMGDSENVQIVFIYNLKTGSMRTYNACT